MKSHGWASLLLAAVVGLSGQRADAAYTRIDTGLPAIESSLLQAPSPAVAEIPADAWLVESIIPLGHTADGQPLALISLLVPNSSLDELAPASTRAGPYAAPKTHTRVFCIVQPPLGLAVQIVGKYVEARVLMESGIGNKIEWKERTLHLPTIVYRFFEQEQEWRTVNLTDQVYAELAKSKYRRPRSGVMSIEREVQGFRGETKAFMTELEKILSTDAGKALFSHIASDNTPLASIWFQKRKRSSFGASTLGQPEIRFQLSEQFANQTDPHFAVIAHEFAHLSESFSDKNAERFPLPSAWIETHHEAVDSRYATFTESLAVRVQNIVAAQYFVNKDKPGQHYFQQLRSNYDDEGPVYNPLPVTVSSPMDGCPTYNERLIWHSRQRTYDAGFYKNF